MSKPLHLIYVPGVADDTTFEPQRRLVRTWRWWGVKAEIFPINWFDDEPWPLKLERLLLRIDTVRANGAKVGLVGASAGALPIICAYAARPRDLVGLVIIAGKINRPEAIGQRYRQKNPSLLPAAEACQLALQKLTPKQREHILSRRAIFDEVVKKPDSYLPGAKNRIVLTAGHAFTILSQLLFGSRSFIKFLKHQASVSKN